MPEQHIEKETTTSLIIDPAHPPRTESEEFRKSKERLKADGHHKCYVCGSEEQIQIHHFGVEYSEAEFADWEKAKEFLLECDVYGYSRLLKGQPLTSADDIRNMVALCQEHHTGVNKEAGNATGIHYLVFPMWVMQKLAKDGHNPVPQKNESIKEAEERIEHAPD